MSLKKTLDNLLAEYPEGKLVISRRKTQNDDYNAYFLFQYGDKELEAVFTVPPKDARKVELIAKQLAKDYTVEDKGFIEMQIK